MTDEVTRFIRDVVEDAGAHGVVIGLSGGVDSSLVAALCIRSLGHTRVRGILLPTTFTPPQDVADAMELAQGLGIRTHTVNVHPLYDAFTHTLNRNPMDATERPLFANVLARIRMTLLYYYANRERYLVAGTGDRSEELIGYFTKYGDGGVDILPLGGLLKGEVRKIAEEIGIPREVIERPPSAGLWHGQTDEGEIGITYEELDRTILAIESGNVKGLDGKVVQKVKRMREASAHKRCGIPYFNK